MYTQG
jgi:uncharacterized protein YoxC